jgi:DNA helicase HerA-like ATPase
MDLSNIRIREHFGLLSNDTNTSKFSFLVSPPKNRSGVSKEDYVIVDHPVFGETCPILGQIIEITSYQEVSGTTIGDRIGKMLATTEIIGYFDLKKENRPLHKLLVPPNPGSRVYVPTTSFLEDILNRNLKGETFAQPLLFGTEASSMEEQQNQNHIKCYIDAQDLLTKHTLIAGMTGAGKTQTAKMLVQEISNKTNTPIVIIDHASEYANLNSDKSQIIVLAAKPEKAARKILSKKVQTKGLNDKNEKETLTKEVKQNQITILNGQGLTIEERRTFFTNCLKTLWKNRTDENTEPFFLLIEESENLKGETLDQMITEGRKNGIAICLLSIHPIELGGRVLSQMSNQIIGKTIDKDDLEYLENVTGLAKTSLLSLAVDEWIINGVNRSRPIKVQAKEETSNPN